MSKMEKQIKHKRNQSIISYKLNRPNTTLSNLGRIYHISKQRVSVILKTYNGGEQ
jgi:hypothetical protein